MKRPCRSDFVANWGRWNTGITDYALATNTPAAGLKRALEDIPVEADPGEERDMGDLNGMCTCITVLAK